MQILIEGNIVGRTPYLYARLEERRLVLENSGPIFLVVDTGFTGSVALQQELIDQLGLRVAAETTFLLANGQKVLLPVYLGQVRLGENSLDTWFVPGENLLGMELLAQLGRELILKFSDDKVVLLG